MRLSRRRLNRTLLRRQHLLERVDLPPSVMAAHLIGLQAQESLAPYLSLAARLAPFDPYAVTACLEAGRLVRLATLRGTLHLHEAADALAVRAWVQASLDQQVRGRVQVDDDVLRAAVHEALSDAPMEHERLSETLAARFPGSGSELVVVARTLLPLVQLPPRGTWRGAGGIVWDHLERVAGAAPTPIDVEQVIRRYLRAFGPATAADLAVWSGVTRLRPVLTRMPDLVRHEDQDGKALFDVHDAPIEDEDATAPVRLLGRYDNVWLAHAGRDRVTEVGTRGNWMGANGGVAMTVFVDGWLTGLWRVAEARVEIIDLFRRLSPVERDELDEEIARVEALLAR
ncbi:MAG: winged helix DNA-binding domain-containing protein [Nocardioides sp.]